MTDNTIIIHWRQQQAPHCRCYSQLLTEPVDAKLDELQAIINRCNAKKVIVYIPGETVFSTQVDLPTQQRQRVLQAIPYALEDQLISELEENHIAISKKPIDGGYGVMVISHQQMKYWCELFKNSNIKVDAIYPDYLGLPLLNGDQVIYQETQKSYLRNNRYVGYTLSQDILEHSGNDPENYKPLVISTEEDHAETVSIYDSENALWLQGIKNLPDYNLLQGDYNRSEQIGKHLKVWRGSALLLALWLMIIFSMDVVDYIRLKQLDNEIQQQVVSTYKDAFPDARKVVNPRVQMEQKLKLLRAPQSQSRFSYLLVISAPELTKVTGFELKTIRYKREKLEVDLKLNSLTELDKLKQQLEEKGLHMKVQSANSKAGRVDARISIGESV